MSWEGWTTIGAVAGVVGLLAATRIGAEIVLLGAVTVLFALGILTPAEALGGFANEGLVTVGALFVVAAGLRETGGINWLVHRVLGRPPSVLRAQARLMSVVVAVSAFLNNTPVVAMFIPAVNDWAKSIRVSVSKLMIPLSYAAIFGGTCTLIGTSTNLVVNGLLISEGGAPGLRMFDITWVGLPCAVVGMTYVLLFSRWLLPERKPVMSQLLDPREYTVEMLVEHGSALAGKSIEGAGLRHLPGMYLLEIERDGLILPAVSPQERLRDGDRLVFVGIVESVVDLQRMRGLAPATNQVFKLDAPRERRCLMEAVVSDSCPLNGRSIREGRFRTIYNAAVIAVARNGARIRKKIGDIVLQPGDTLLLEAHPSFAEQHRNSRDFFLVSRVEDSTPPRHDRAWRALLILAGLVLVAGAGWMSMLKAAMIAAGLMLVGGCCSGPDARRAIEWQVLLVIGGALALGQALDKTGAAEQIARAVIGLAGGHPWLTLVAVYGIATVFTEVITNNAAAALVFPIALAAARSLDVNFMPFVAAIMIASSASFATPLGYQTNLMVLGPGGYRFTDYLRIGIPLNLLMWLTTALLAPLVWGF